MRHQSPFHFMLTSLLLFSAAGQTMESTKSEECGFGTKTMRVGARHIEGNGIGYDKGYSTLELFLGKKFGEHNLPFIDLRGHIFDNGKYAANAGLGYRDVFYDRIYGINAYYDYRQTHRHNYKQVGLGLETMGTRWDFRINGYWPVGRKSSHFYNPCFDSFCGNTLFIEKKQQFAMKGVHAEAGAHLGKLLRKTKLLEPVDFYAAIGPYYFEGKGKNAYGGQFRLAARYQEFIRVEFNTSYDNVFKDIYQGQIGFYLPFGPKPKVTRKYCCKSDCGDIVLINERMTQPVVRDEIIVTTSHHKSFAANQCNSCDPLVFWFVNNLSSSSLGTFEHPFATLLEAQNASQINDVIYVFPGNRTTTGMDQGITLKDNQQLLGAAVNHFIASNCGSVCIPICADHLPEITSHTLLTPGVITIANNNTVSGLAILPVLNLGGEFGIVNSAPISNAFINRNLFDTSLNGGKAPGNPNSIVLTNVSGNVDIACNEFNNTFAAPISITGTNLEDTHYLIQKNRAFSPAFSSVVLTLNNSDNVSTTLTRNAFFGGLGSGSAPPVINMTLTNGTKNSIIVNQNELVSDGRVIVLALNNSSQTSLIIEDNKLQAPNTGTAFNLSLTNSSTAYLSLSRNDMDAFTADFNISVTDSSLNASILENLFNSDGSGANTISNTTSASTTSSVITGVLNGNIFNDNRSSTTADLNITGAGNSISDYLITNNEFNFGLNGLTLSGSGLTTQMRAKIANNSFNENTNRSLSLVNTSGSRAIWLVTDNTFNGWTGPATTAAAAFISQGGTGSTCLRFTGNDATPTQLPLTTPVPAYQFVQTGGTFNREPLVNNIGTVKDTGTITNVPAGTCK